MAPTSTAGGGAGVRLPAPMWAALVASFTVVGALHFRSAPRLGFLGDDTWVVGKVATGSPWGDHRGVGTEFFRPLSSLALWLEHAAFGADAAGYHVVGVAVHLVNSLLVVAVAAAAFGVLGDARSRVRPARRARRAAIVAGAVFLVHPSHGEAVYWISAQPDLFATLFSLVAVLTLLHSGRGDRAWRAVSVTAAALALLCKESATGTLLVVALLAVIIDGAGDGATASGDPAMPRRALGRLRTVVPYFGVGVVYLLARWAALGTPIGGYGSGTYTDPSVGHLVASVAVAAARTLLPSMASPAWFVTAGLCVGIGAAVVAIGQGGDGRTPFSRTVAPSLMVATALTLLPAAPLGVSSAGPLGERNVYLASVFTAGLVAVMAVAAAHRFPRSTVVAGVAVALLLGGVGLREERRWSDASAAADAMTDSLADVDGGPVLLFNVPDTVRGAIAFRNSAAGLDLYGPRYAALEALVVTTREFASPDDVDRARLLPDGRTVRVTVTDPMPSGPTRPSESDRGAWTVRATGPASYDVILEAPADADSLRYFSGGRLRPVD